VVVGVRGPGSPYPIPADSNRRRRPGQITLRSCRQAG
jgi:hypothetical protein